MKNIDELIAELTPNDYAYMKANWEDKQEEVFTHYEEETGITRHINVDRLWEAINAHRVKVDGRMMVIDDELYHLICKHQGIERSHLTTITPDQAAYDEALAVEFDGGERHIIIDGNHKIVRAYEMGLRRRPCLFVNATALDPFLMHPPKLVSDLMVAATRANLQVNVTEQAPESVKKYIPHDYDRHPNCGCTNPPCDSCPDPRMPKDALLTEQVTRPDPAAHN